MRLWSGMLMPIVAGALVIALPGLYGAQAAKKRATHAAAASVATAPPSAEEIADLAWMRAHTTASVPYELDLSQPNQYRFVMNMLRRGGQSAQRSPRLFSLLQAKRGSGPGADPKIAVKLASGGGLQPLTYIGSLNATGARSYQATGLLSVNGGTATSMIAISLLAGDQTYAATSQSQYGDGKYFTVSTSGTVPSNVGSPTTAAHAVFLYLLPGSNNPIVTYYSGVPTVNATSACMQAPNYCVRNAQGNCIPGQYQTACTNQVKNTTPIKVCYYRGAQYECDYWNEGGRPTTFLFPLQGAAQFPQDIVPANAPQGALSITLENPIKGGGCYLVFQQVGPLNPANWSVQPDNPKQLNWNYPAAAFPDPNHCLEENFASNVFLHVQLLGLLTGGGFGQFEFTSNRMQIGQPGIDIVPVMQILQ